MADKQLLNLKQLINRNVQAVMPQEDQKMDFKKNISDYINKLKINENQSEEFQKGISSANTLSSNRQRKTA